MIKVFPSLSRGSLPSFIVALVTGTWVYFISDNPLKLALSFLIGLCCGIVAFFVFTDKYFDISINRVHVSSKKVVLILFVLFVLSSFVPSVEGLFVSNWFSLPLLNWLRFVISIIFVFFLSGFIILRLLGVHRKVPMLVSLVLSVLVSMYVTSVLWFIAKMFSLSNGVSFGFFAFAQLIFVCLYCFRAKDPLEGQESRRRLSLNIVLPLAAIVAIFVSLTVLQVFVFEPFVRGDSWDYVGTSMAIGKGAYDLVPAGKFYSFNLPNFFETFLSAFTGSSGFPIVNSFLILNILVATLIPTAFFLMCQTYMKNAKASLLSAFLFVVASGFGWIPFISSKFASGESYSIESLPLVIDNFAPQVISDITQPQGVLSEGLKTYAFGVLAIIMLLYLFKSKLGLKARLPLIAIICAFGFQYHIEEILIFTLAFVPAYLVLSRGEKPSLRYNVCGLICGLAIALGFGLLASHGLTVISNSFFVGMGCIVFLGLFLGFTFLKTDNLLSLLNGVFLKYKHVLFFLALYLFVFAVVVLVYYGYPAMTSTYSLAVVSQGLSIPWYYYPMILGVAGILTLIGLSMRFSDRTISFFFLITVLSVILAVFISFLNQHVSLTGAKEWRIIYRVLPIPMSVFAGSVLLRLLNLEVNIRNAPMVFRRKSLKFRADIRHFSVLLLLLVIVLGIPSTLIGSEYWMSSGLNPHGNIHPQAADIELANYFSNVSITSRAAVSSYDSNALIRLAGGTTAMPGTYLNVLALTRPETIALVSSDVRFIVLDKTSDSVQPSALLNYLPIVFDNSKYTVFRLPYLQSSVSESEVGYVAPKSYDNYSLLSFMLISSLNSTYQIINDSLHDKSVIILPYDFIQRQPGASSDASNYFINEQTVLKWVADGGKLIVFGGEGAVFDYLGFTSNFSKTAVDSIASSGLYRFTEVQTNTFSFDRDEIDVLSYYQLRGNNVCPFAMEKQVGKGTIVYYYMDPLYKVVSQSENGKILNPDLLSAFSASLNYLPRTSNDELWLLRYRSYATNDFTASGLITIASNVSGSGFAENFRADSLIVNGHTLEYPSDFTIYNITVDSRADLLIRSSKLVSIGRVTTPNYFSFEVSNSSIILNSIDSGLLRINSDKGVFIGTNISFRSKSASLVTESPNISVEGNIFFENISIPANGSPWSTNVNFVGKTEFHIAYGDSNYVFIDRYSYPSWQSESIQEPILPLNEILLSPFNFGSLVLVCGSYFMVKRVRCFRRIADSS